MGVQAVEDRQHVVGHDLRAAPASQQRVEADRVLARARIEHHRVLMSLWRDPAQDLGDQVALGLDDHHAAAGGDVGTDQVGQQRALAGAGRADDVQVMAGVGDGQPKRTILAGRSSGTDDAAMRLDARIRAQPTAGIARNPRQRFVPERPAE